MSARDVLASLHGVTAVPSPLHGRRQIRGRHGTPSFSASLRHHLPVAGQLRTGDRRDVAGLWPEGPDARADSVVDARAQHASQEVEVFLCANELRLFLSRFVVGAL